MAWSEVARVIQGLTAGIGFLGGGAILKWHETQEVHGLTTAAGLWMTAALGVATGLGRLGTALLGALLTWVVLAVLAHLERPHAPHQRVEHNNSSGDGRKEPVMPGHDIIVVGTSAARRWKPDKSWWEGSLATCRPRLHRLACRTHESELSGRDSDSGRAAAGDPGG